MTNPRHQFEQLESLTGLRDMEFPQYERPPSKPYEIAQDWLSAAQAQNVREPLAMTLSTRNSAGEITSRIVAPTRFDGRTLQIATHSTSRKAADIASTRSVVGHLYWRELGRQLSVSGNARLMPDAMADLVWRQRAPGYDGVSTVSEQSQPLSSREALVARLDQVDQTQKLPRPTRFVIFEVDIQRYEFWSATSDRVHRRLAYNRGNKGWVYERLQP